MRYGNRHFHPVALLVASWLLAALSGCRDNNELTSPPAIPGVMESEGRRWSRQGELSTDDRAMLDGYFRTHMSEIDNPIFEADAVVYGDGAGARRIYWFAMSAEGLRWFYLEFDSRDQFQQSGNGVKSMETAAN